jgi:hypothetical protein
MPGLRTFIDRDGTRVEVWRDGRKVYDLRGLLSSKGPPHVSFLPGADVQAGDVLCLSGEDVRVTSIKPKQGRRIILTS